MIEVTIFKSSGSYKSLNVNGHAGYSEYGSDIICASISALVINFINSMINYLAIIKQDYKNN